MSNRSNRGLEQPFRAKRLVRVKVIGIQSADFIKARGQSAPHIEAGHMAASDRSETLPFSLENGTVQTWLGLSEQLAFWHWSPHRAASEQRYFTPRLTGVSRWPDAYVTANHSGNLLTAASFEQLLT
jgi:hypothetical protein